MLGIKTIGRAISQIKGWYRLYKLTADPFIEQELKSSGFKISWHGIPYKLLPIPNEFMENQMTLQNYIFSQLREINDTIAVPLRLADLIYPAFKDVAPGVYLIKLEPNTNEIQFKNIVPILALWGILGFVITKLWVKYDAWFWLGELWNSIVAFLG